MAKSASPGYWQEPATVGPVASFAFPASHLWGAAMPPPVSGYPGYAAGGSTPTAQGYYDQATGADSGTSNAQYAVTRAAGPVSKNPIFWSFVLVTIGVIGFGHLAHVSVR